MYLHSRVSDEEQVVEMISKFLFQVIAAVATTTQQTINIQYNKLIMS